MQKIQINDTLKADLVMIVTSKVAEMHQKAYSYYTLSGGTLNAFHQLCHIQAVEMALAKQPKNELNVTHYAFYTKCEHHKQLFGHLNFHLTAAAGSNGEFSSMKGADRVLIKPTPKNDDSHCVLLSFCDYNKAFQLALRRQVALLIEKELIEKFDLLPIQAKRSATKVCTQNKINWNAFQNEVEFKTTGGKYALPEERHAYFDNKFLII